MIDDTAGTDNPVAEEMCEHLGRWGERQVEMRNSYGERIYRPTETEYLREAVRWLCKRIGELEAGGQ